MLFNPEPSKQEIEVLFSKKNTRTPRPILTFNNNFFLFFLYKFKERTNYRTQPKIYIKLKNIQQGSAPTFM